MKPIEQIHESYVFGRRVRRLSTLLADLMPSGARCLDVGSGSEVERLSFPLGEPGEGESLLRHLPQQAKGLLRVQPRSLRHVFSGLQIFAEMEIHLGFFFSEELLKNPELHTGLCGGEADGVLIQALAEPQRKSGGHRGVVEGAIDSGVDDLGRLGGYLLCPTPRRYKTA